MHAWCGMQNEGVVPQGRRAGAAHVLKKKVRSSPVPNVSAMWIVPKPVACVSQFALTPTECQLTKNLFCEFRSEGPPNG
jgi:hypothetical protein